MPQDKVTEALTRALAVLNEEVQKRVKAQLLKDWIKTWMPPLWLPGFGGVTASNPTDEAIAEWGDATCDQFATEVQEAAPNWVEDPG